MAKSDADRNVISLRERRMAHQQRAAQLEREARAEQGEAVVSTTVLTQGDEVHLAFSRPIHGLHLHKREAEQLALWLLASVEGGGDEHGEGHG